MGNAFFTGHPQEELPPDGKGKRHKITEALQKVPVIRAVSKWVKTQAKDKDDPEFCQSTLMKPQQYKPFRTAIAEPEGTAGSRVWITRAGKTAMGEG